MSKELFSEAKNLWDRSEKADKFVSRFKVYPYNETTRIIEDIRNLSDRIEIVDQPLNKEEVYNNELKRRLDSQSLLLDHWLSGHYYTFGEVLEIFGIDQKQIDDLRNWLLENKEETLDSIDRVFHATDVEHYEMKVPLDIPRHRRQVEEFAATNIELYQKNIAALFNTLQSAGGYLRDVTAVPLLSDRSYFHPITKVLALEVGAICYMTENQTFHVNERELIRLFGHEGMGHGLNTIVTEKSDLPEFLKTDATAVRGTVESVAQYYEEEIFEVLRSDLKTQKNLQIAHKFEEIYQEEMDTRQINRYMRKLMSYGISVLADKDLGDLSDYKTRQHSIQARIQKLSDVSFSQSYAVDFIENNLRHFNSQGNLNFYLAEEMKYDANPAEKVVELAKEKGIEYSGEGRAKIDELLLTGYWTPAGLIENARVSLNNQ